MTGGGIIGKRVDAVKSCSLPRVCNRRISPLMRDDTSSHSNPSERPCGKKRLYPVFEGNTSL
jgi:hypothetical protein